MTWTIYPWRGVKGSKNPAYNIVQLPMSPVWVYMRKQALCGDGVGKQQMTTPSQSKEKAGEEIVLQGERGVPLKHNVS